MKITEVKSKIIFKSGYPTFGTTNGHLSHSPNQDVYDLLHLGFKPSGILEQKHKLDYKA